MRSFKSNELTVQVFSNRLSMGGSAAADVSSKISELLRVKSEINMIFAAAPSQNEFLSALIADETIPWNRINAFHMDEYIGLAADAPQGFGNYLSEQIFKQVPLKNVYYIQMQTDDLDGECTRYTQLLSERKIDIVCMGIGENGHIAFNDPHVADFNDPKLVKVVDLDMECRQQQINDGCFDTIEEVPVQAITLTIPMLISAQYVFCIVPGETKAQATYETLNNLVDEACPATILRTKESAQLYLDSESASLLKLKEECLI